MNSTTAAQPSAPHATVSCAFCGTMNRVDLSRLDAGPKCGSCARPILLDRPVAVSDPAFDAALAGTDVPVLVDFWAEWCGPCKMMAPVLDEIAHERQGRAVVLKLDTDRNPLQPQRFGVRGIPTFIVFSRGREVGRAVGAVPRAEIDALLSRAAKA